MINKGLFKELPIKDLYINNQQDNIQNQRDQLVSKELLSLNFRNYFKYQSNLKITTTQVSNDERYLAIGIQRKILIYNIKSKKVIKNIQLNDQMNTIEIIKFSNNSIYLLFGDSYGYLCCQDVSQNYKIIYIQKIHQTSIFDILTIDNNQILTCSGDRSIIITNIKLKQQLLEIENAHSSWINAVVYDKIHNYIISCSSDNSIKLFNRKHGKLQIYQQNAHAYVREKQGQGIEMIQLIPQRDNLISSDYEYLILWLIDYQRLQLNKLKYYQYNIYNFTSVFKNNYIVVIYNNLNVQQSIKHNIRDLNYYFKIRQLDTLNYLIVTGSDSLLILKKVRDL